MLEGGRGFSTRQFICVVEFLVCPLLFGIGEGVSKMFSGLISFNSGQG